jgi:hypothetical protein
MWSDALRNKVCDGNMVDLPYMSLCVRVVFTVTPVGFVIICCNHNHYPSVTNFSPVLSSSIFIDISKIYNYCFWTLPILLLLSKHNVSETGFCLRLTVSGPVRRYYLRFALLGPVWRHYLRFTILSGPKIGTGSIYWSQVSRFRMETETEFSPRNFVFLNKNMTMVNVQKHNNCINIPSS